MGTGTVTRLVRDRGFGFIQPAEGGSDLFFHSTSVDDGSFPEMNEGEKVEFDTEPDPRQSDRSRAVHVRRTG